MSYWVNIKQVALQSVEWFKPFMQRKTMATLKAEGDRRRREFLKNAGLEPPSQVRLIDCDATCEKDDGVVLMDWWANQHLEYVAISHTFGMQVYDVFDCECTTQWHSTLNSTKVPRCCSEKPCPGHASDSDPRNQVVKDIRYMCAILRSAGVKYAWHDGVCIAQHNKDEVEDTIKHIGWIYSHARETIIFLHYVGEPMAPIRLDRGFNSRWQTRVWTLQEAALSKRRRYCVRVGSTRESARLGSCKSLQEFEDKIGAWCKEESSKVTVIKEEAFFKIIMELYSLIAPLAGSAHVSISADDEKKVETWIHCLDEWMDTLTLACYLFPTLGTAFKLCSGRDSKHEGDRINSILALAGVKDFVAPKDENLEASTIEFFKRQGQQGLARALFTANTEESHIRLNRQCTWVPMLMSNHALRSVYECEEKFLIDVAATDDTKRWLAQTSSSHVEDFIKFTVLEDGKLELRGEMVCVAVKVTYIAGTPWEDSRTQEYDPLVVIRDNSGTNVDPATTSILAMDLIFEMGGLFRLLLAQASSLALGTAVVPMIINSTDQLPARHTSGCGSWASEVLGKVGGTAFSCCGLDHARADDHYTTAVQQCADQKARSLLSNGALARACSTMEPGWMAGIPLNNDDAASTSPPHELNPQVPALFLGDAYFSFLSSDSGFGRPLIQGREIQDKGSFWAHMVLPLQSLIQHHAFASSHQPSRVPRNDWRVPAVLVQGDLDAQVSKVGCFRPTKYLRNIITQLLPTLTKLDKLVIT